MKISLTLTVVFLLLSLILPAYSAVAGTTLTEEKALNVLGAQVEKDKLYDIWTTSSCLAFIIIEKTKNYFDIDIHEKHGGTCPGDPNTFPIVDRFQVNRITGNIQWYDTETELHPYEAILKRRKAK